ncbi:hypothetical protein P886_4013 [Alteromonadaceae bacterium 2753L.S.0a.02]|nr:hypothetical protein P886_4013 [Alteromonadaceae bacterium 2753L.S.0a.02]
MPSLHYPKSVVIISTLLLLPTLAIAQTDDAKVPTEESAANTAEPMQASEESNDPAATNANASGNYTCALNGLVRRVEIAYDDATLKVPCAVNYYKDSEAPNEMSTLWSAQNMAGYCEEKANQFVEKLQSWGWSCNLN